MSRDFVRHVMLSIYGLMESVILPVSPLADAKLVTRTECAHHAKMISP